MAEPFGIVSGVLGTLSQIVLLLDEVASRFKLVSTNRAYFTRLREEYTQISRLLGNVDTLLRHPHARPSPAAADNFSCILDHVHSLLRRADDATAVSDRVGSTPENNNMGGCSSRPRLAKMRRLGEHAMPYVRARKTEAELIELESVLDKARVSLVGLTTNTEICRQFGEMMEVGMGHQEDGVFKATFTLPHLPSRVVLRWGSAADTMEAALKKALWGSRRDGEWGVVVGAQGLGGVGKTTALIGLGKEEDVQQWFKDGVYWIHVGKDASEEKVVKMLADMVEGCGGVKSCVSIGKSRKLSEAVGRAGRYFDGKRALFLVDDIWTVEGDGTGYLGKMRGLLSGCPDSRIVMSTRSKEVAHEGGRRVEFGPRENQSATAREMLFFAANIKGEDRRAVVVECKKEVAQVLQFCGGVPLTLGVAGRAIHMMEDGGGCVQRALRLYAERTREGSAEVLAASLGSYPNFRASVRISLKMISRVMHEQYPDGEWDNVVVGELYKRFAVIRKQTYVPTDMVQKLWKFGSTQLVDVLLQRLSDLNLVLRKIGESGQLETGLHDLLIEFCRVEAREEEKQYHAELLVAYCDVPMQHGSTGDSCRSPVDGSVRPWWDEEFASNKYLMVNLARHLGGSEKVRELAGLLTDARWTMRRLKTGGLLGWNEDFATLLAALPHAVNDAELSAANIKKGFILVRDVVRDSWGYILRNDTEFAYQMHARLQGMDTSWPARRFLWTAARIASRPWLRALTRCWPVPGSTLLTLPLGVSVQSVSMAGRVGAFQVGMDVVVVDLDSGETISTLREKELISMCAVNANGRVAVTAASDFVRVWDVHSGQQKCASVYSSTDSIKGLAVTADGARVMIVSADGLMQVWDTEKGNEMSAAGGVRGDAEVECVALRSNGRFAVAGSTDGTLRWWDYEKGAAPAKTWQGGKDEVTCVAMTPGGEVVVSGSSNRIVRVWKVKESPAGGRCLYGHTDSVTCVDVSTDAQIIVSGSDDKTIRVWTGGCVTSRVLQGHTDGVSGVCMDLDGRRILSGSWDGTACVWAVGSTTSSAPQERAHNAWVSCLGASADRQSLASIDLDGGLVLWDVGQQCVSWTMEAEDMDEVIAMAVSAGGEYVASIMCTGEVLVWSRDTKKEIWRMKMDGGVQYAATVGMTEAGWTVVGRAGRLGVWTTKVGLKGGEGTYVGKVKGMRVCGEIVTLKTDCGRFRWRVAERDGELVPVDALVDEGVSGEGWGGGRNVTMVTEGGRCRWGLERRDGESLAVEMGDGDGMEEQSGDVAEEVKIGDSGRTVKFEGVPTLATLPMESACSMILFRRREGWHFRRQRLLVVGLEDGCILWHEVVE